MRHAYEDRWPTVLEQGLGGAARVIAEGLGGRTTAFDDHTGLPDRNGARILPTAARDAHATRCGHPHAREQRTSKIHRKCCRSGARHEAADRDHPHLSLRRLRTPLLRSWWWRHRAWWPQSIQISDPCSKDGIEESERLAEHYRRLSEDAGVTYFDAATVATMTPLDGAHLDAANTRALGHGLGACHEAGAGPLADLIAETGGSADYSSAARHSHIWWRRAAAARR